MKMVNSLLLASAAGVVAVSGAQAADLPVKAKPVEYVKVCSLYGAGFYYIPGTDICLKIGAAFRAEYAVGNFGSSLTNLDATGADGQRTRITGPDYQQRARSYLWLDARQQTAYGTLRAYMNVGHNSDFAAGNTNATNPSATAIYANRAFIQLAGFTWGLATSYYDFYSSPATSYSVPWSSDTGDGGYKVAAYTAQLGNGVSASLSLEEPRRQVVTNTSIIGGTFNTAAPALGSACAGTYGPGSGLCGTSPLAGLGTITSPSQVVYTVGALPIQDELKTVMPDIVANLRIDQAWGSAQVMGALHKVGGGYYGSTFGAGSGFLSTCANGTSGGSGSPGTFQGNTCSGHPDDKMGWAVGAGVKINFPMIGPGDYLQAQYNYTVGASRYAALTPAGAGGPGIFGEGTGQGTTLGMGFFQDGVYCGGGSLQAYGGPISSTIGQGQSVSLHCGSTAIQLTKVWSAQAAYEHFWTPSLKTSLVGAYTHIGYNDEASMQMCSQMGAQSPLNPNMPIVVPTPGPNGKTIFPSSGVTNTPGANTINGLTSCGSGSFDWSYWSVSSRTQWNITKDFYVGLEGYYGHLNTMSKGQTVFYSAATGTAQPSGVRTLDDQNVFVYRMRVHRDIVP